MEGIDNVLGDKLGAIIMALRTMAVHGILLKESPQPKKFKTQTSAGKIMATHFGILHVYSCRLVWKGDKNKF